MDYVCVQTVLELKTQWRRIKNPLPKKKMTLILRGEARPSQVFRIRRKTLFATAHPGSRKSRGMELCDTRVGDPPGEGGGGGGGEGGVWGGGGGGFFLGGGGYDSGRGLLGVRWVCWQQWT